VEYSIFISLVLDSQFTFAPNSSPMNLKGTRVLPFSIDGGTSSSPLFKGSLLSCSHLK